MQFAATVARRLPATFAALAAGRIHPLHLRIIEDETSVLSDQDAATADAILAAAAAGMTFGEVRAAAHKVVLKLDPVLTCSGILTWHTPSGRRYVTTPTRYAS